VTGAIAFSKASAKALSWLDVAARTLFVLRRAFCLLGLRNLDIEGEKGVLKRQGMLEFDSENIAGLLFIG